MIKFRKITKDDLLMILRWRTDPDVSRYMSTDIDFDIVKQTDWYEKVVCTRIPAEHWVICHNENPVGVLNLENYNSGLQETSWGYYIGEIESRIIGALVPAYFYNYMFFNRNLLLKKINGHLFTQNIKVLSMHRFYGVKEVEVLKNHVCKHGEEFDLTVIEMTQENWVSQRKKFQHYQAVFED
jgi:RimJ/RimL family protein N-acetyltransferase